MQGDASSYSFGYSFYTICIAHCHTVCYNAGQTVSRGSLGGKHEDKPLRAKHAPHAAVAAAGTAFTMSKPKGLLPWQLNRRCEGWGHGFQDSQAQQQ